MYIGRPPSPPQGHGSYGHPGRYGNSGHGNYGNYGYNNYGTYGHGNYGNGFQQYGPPDPYGHLQAPGHKTSYGPTRYVAPDHKPIKPAPTWPRYTQSDSTGRGYYDDYIRPHKTPQVKLRPPKAPSTFNLYKGRTDTIYTTQWLESMQTYLDWYTLHGNQWSQKQVLQICREFMDSNCKSWMSARPDIHTFEHLRLAMLHALNPAVGTYQLINQYLRPFQGKLSIDDYIHKHDARSMMVPHFETQAALLTALHATTMIQGLKPQLRSKIENWDKLPTLNLGTVQALDQIQQRIRQVEYSQWNQNTLSRLRPDTPNKADKPRKPLHHITLNAFQSIKDKAEQKRLYDNDLCFKCGKPGHKARNCPEKKSFNCFIADINEALQHDEHQPSLQQIELPDPEPSMLDNPLHQEPDTDTHNQHSSEPEEDSQEWTIAMDDDDELLS